MDSVGDRRQRSVRGHAHGSDYDAACYACLTGRLEQARQFLELAIAMGNAQEVKLRALDDPDLEPLWKKSGAV